jgi:hypothetical protein
MWRRRRLVRRRAIGVLLGVTAARHITGGLALAVRRRSTMRGLVLGRSADHAGRTTWEINQMENLYLPTKETTIDPAGLEDRTR